MHPQLRRLDGRAITSTKNEIAAFIIVRDELVRLPELLDYHQRLGVEKFFIVDNDSSDDTSDYLLSRREVHGWHAAGNFRDAGNGIDWMKALLDEFAADRWSLLIDADEFFVYPGCERIALPALCRYLDRVGARVLPAMLLDMYSDRPVAQTRYRPGDAMLQVCPYFDHGPYWIDPRHGGRVGGVRARVFWEGKSDQDGPPLLRKFPLQRWVRGSALTIGRHKTTLPGADITSVSGALLHFKFDDSIVPKATREVARKVYWNDASDYRRYVAVFAQKPDISLYGPSSVRYENSEQLIRLGLISAGPNYWRSCRDANARLALAETVPTAARDGRRSGSIGFSLIVNSRNRRDRLAQLLESLDAEALLRFGFELVLVDSASEDRTLDLMREFASRAPFPVQVVRVALPGSGRARNSGVAAAQGGKLLFTDDDCSLDRAYLSRFVATFDEAEFQYGGGSIDVPDPRDDQITTFRSAAKRIIPPRSLLRAGDIQGANLFFLRSALEKIGGFREDWGAGMTIGGEDIELCTRASLAGYTGAILPDLVVHHHHGRRPGSVELSRQLALYDRGRGAYFAALIAGGVPDGWKLWAQTRAEQGSLRRPFSSAERMQFERELRGAADSLAGELRRGAPTRSYRPAP